MIKQELIDRIQEASDLLEAVQMDERKVYEQKISDGKETLIAFCSREEFLENMIENVGQQLEFIIDDLKDSSDQ